ncbi:MAG: hypothetical protein RIM72_19325 [Alphaproteobacteria bacterium]
MNAGFRLLPAVIFVAVLMLTVKVGSIYQALNDPDNTVAENPLQLTEARAQQDSTQQPESEAVTDDFEGFEDIDDAPPEGFEPIEGFDADAEGAFDDIASLTPGEMRLLHDLAKRRDRIQTKESELAEREALLQAAEQQLMVQQEKLEDIRSEIDSLLERYDTEQVAEQEELRKIYSAMKPKSAAAIFDELDLDTLTGVLRGMSARKIAPIIAAMNPEKARLLTREMAEKRDLPELPQ